MLCVADGDRERVGSVRGPRGRSGQQHSHHHRHLPLLRMACADHRLLDEIGGIFGHRQAGQGQCREGDAARLAQLQRRLRVPVDEMSPRPQPRAAPRVRCAQSASDGSSPAARPATTRRRSRSSRSKRSSAATRPPRSRPIRSRAGRDRRREFESRRWSWRRLDIRIPAQGILARQGAAAPGRALLQYIINS